MKPYRDFASLLSSFFPYKVQKISVNAGLSCPNRDGTKGWGGCTYCNNQTFSPEYCLNGRNVKEQMQEGIRFFSQKYPAMKYLAYFQSYTGSYGDESTLVALYEEALSCPSTVGIILGTRPDCMSGQLLDYFTNLSRKYFVMIEYGLESTLDKSLIRINRGHTHADSEDAIRRTADRNIPVGAHLILGLPGETHQEILHHATAISHLPLTSVKLHQLQLVRHTKMAQEYASDPNSFHFPSIDEYIDLVIDFLERLNPAIAVERFVSQSPANLLIAPHWGLKNHVITEKVKRKMSVRGAYQGRLFRLP